MRIAVTGASGFLGRYVVERLARQPENELFIYGRHHDVASASFKNAHARNLDLFDSETIRAISDEVDALVHLAWVGIPKYDDSIHLAQVPCHLNLIRKFANLGARKIFISGTCFEYGSVEGEIGEGHALNPSNEYASAKNQLRILAEELSTDLNINLTWGRLFYLYGKDQPIHSFFGSLLMAANSGKSSYRIAYPELCLDYSSASVMAGYIDCLVRSEEPVGIVNLGSGTPRALGLLAQSWIREFELSIDLEFGNEECKSQSFWADVSKLRSFVN
jgi:nucleoside-diphosphate-sugar epimerase